MVAGIVHSILFTGVKIRLSDSFHFFFFFKRLLAGSQVNRFVCAYWGISASIPTYSLVESDVQHAWTLQVSKCGHHKKTAFMKAF